MGDFFTIELLKATLRMATPLLFAALGGLMSERSGIMNIALEGLMLIGAFFAVAGTSWTGNPWLGLLIGIAAASVGAAIHAVWCITFRADQIVAGTAINLVAAGITAFLVQRIWHKAGGSDQVQKLPYITSKMPVIGGVSVLVPISFLLVPIIWFVLFRTKPGLRILAGGEYPQAAESVGINVTRYRYICVILSGVFAGLGGAYLSIGDLNYFTLDMTSGRGFIALAAMILGGWTPLGAMLATLLFGASQAVQIQAQAVGNFPISPDLLVAFPYILTLVALVAFVRHVTPPAGLGKHATSG